MFAAPPWVIAAAVLTGGWGLLIATQDRSLGTRQRQGTETGRIARLTLELCGAAVIACG